MKYVEVLYNIPDIDETGIAKGTELALRFIDVHTIWLPSWLRTYHDNRGKGRKDLRDWMELRNTRKDFRNLMTLAMPARFWVSKLNKRPTPGTITLTLRASIIFFASMVLHLT